MTKRVQKWTYNPGCSCSRCVIRRRIDQIVGRLQA